MMLFFHDFTKLNKVSSVNLRNWLYGNSSYAQSFCSKNKKQQQKTTLRAEDHNDVVLL